MKTGNVIKIGKSIEVVIIVKDDGVITIPIDYSNTSIYHKNKSELENSQCWNCDYFDDTISRSSDECDNCKGTGYYEEERIGLDKAKILSDNIKDYIISSLSKNFGF